jgi:hypothetical protein
VPRDIVLNAARSSMKILESTSRPWRPSHIKKPVGVVRLASWLSGNFIIDYGANIKLYERESGYRFNKGNLSKQRLLDVIQSNRVCRELLTSTSEPTHRTFSLVATGVPCP